MTKAKIHKNRKCIHYFFFFFFSKETYFVDSRVLFPHSILQPDCFHIKWIKDEQVACVLPLPHWGGKTLYVCLSKDTCQCPSEGKGSFPPCLLSVLSLQLNADAAPDIWPFCPAFQGQGLECSSLASIFSHLFFVPFFPHRHGLTKLVQAAVGMKRVKDTERF